MNKKMVNIRSILDNDFDEFIKRLNNGLDTANKKFADVSVVIKDKDYINNRNQFLIAFINDSISNGCYTQFVFEKIKLGAFKEAVLKANDKIVVFKNINNKYLSKTYSRIYKNKKVYVFYIDFHRNKYCLIRRK